ncbi:MAG: 2-succinyl-5-enolpyruvyl-6-hydroxy-3-cyclohexene-1-carboxylic-acid synthase, partial [Bacteroidota bacterium]
MNVNTEQFEILAQMAAAYGIKQWVLSPGSRCAPITLALVRCPDTQTRSVSDERSAAYIALGMAEALGEPVGLLCTSGTAALNYAPAIAEAFYKKVPLFVLTADRPPEWLNQQDGQAIPQQNIYGRTVKGSFELPVSQAHTDERHYFVRILSEAMNLCLAGPGGPVHVNVPVREPFYPEPSYKMRFDRPVKMIRENRFIPKVDKFLMNELANQWLSTEKKLMVAGQHLPDLDLRNAVHACRTYNSVPVVADITANLSTVENLVTRHDLFLQPADAGAFQPDLLVTFGDTLLSKNLKGFLRKYPAKEHWHIQAGGDV